MVRVRELSENEAQRLQRIVRRGAKNIVTWRRATVVLASSQGQKVSVIAKLVQTSEDRVREMIHIFNEAGMDSLFPRWSEGRPATFMPKVRARIEKAIEDCPERVVAFDELGPLTVVPTPDVLGDVLGAARQTAATAGQLPQVPWATSVLRGLQRQPR